MANRKNLRIVSNNRAKQKGSLDIFDAKWLFNNLDDNASFLDHVVQMDKYNGARRIMQCQYMIEKFPELFKRFRNIETQAKMSPEEFKGISEVYMYLAYEMLLVSNFQYASEIFERLVYSMREINEDNYNFLIGYAISLAGSGKTAYFDKFAEVYPEETFRPYFQICKMYSLFHQRAYQQLNEATEYMEIAFPDLLDVILDKKYINLYLQKQTFHRFDVDDFNLSEEHRDILVSLGMVVDFGLNIMVVVEYIQSRYEHFNPLRIHQAEAAEKKGIKSFMSYLASLKEDEEPDLGYLEGDKELYDGIDYEGLNILLWHGFYDREDFLEVTEQELLEREAVTLEMLEYLKGKNVKFRKNNK